MIIQQKLKVVTILSAISFLLMLTFLITLILREYRDTTVTTTSAQTYFILKDAFQSQVGHRARIAFAAAAICFQIMLLLMMLWLILCKENLRSQTVNGHAIYILISIIIITTIPPAGFYANIVIDRYRKQKMLLYWDEISMFCQGITSLILIIICWVIVIRSLHIQLINNSDFEQRNNVQGAEYVCKQKKTELQKSQRQTYSVDKEQKYKQLIQKLNQNPMSSLNQKPPMTLHQANQNNFQYAHERYYQSSQNQQITKRTTKLTKKKKQAQKLQRLLLKAQIQRRKKKFRQINPNRIRVNQEGYQDLQYQIDKQGCKLTKLPKTYRQYIKDAKKPTRIAPKKIVTSIIHDEHQSEQVHQYQEQAISFPENESQMPILTKKKPLQQNLLAKEELVYSKCLKKKQKKKKNLFDETADQYQVQFQKNQTEYIRLNKFSKKNQLTLEKEIMSLLKNRYNEPQQNI